MIVHVVPSGHVHGEKLEDGLASVPEERRALYYFEWLDKKQNLDIDHSLLKSLLQEADINAQGKNKLYILRANYEYTCMGLYLHGIPGLPMRVFHYP